MRCDEFEQALQAQADGSGGTLDSALLDEHARGCRDCRQLEQEFRLLMQAFAVTVTPRPAADLTDRIVRRALEAPPRRGPLFWARIQRPAVGFGLLTAAAVLVAALLGRMGSRPVEPDVTLPDLRTVAQSPPGDELLFPELGVSADPRDSLALVEAAEPISGLLRAMGRSLQSPVRPIAQATSEAVEEFINDLPDSGLPAMPGMMMPSPMKKTMDKSPSS